MVNNSQKGVSLIITFFITIIILFVVLATSAILYSQIKVMRNIGNSVVAFYAADSGVEKVLYYDWKNKVGETRGICNICTPGVCTDCTDCVPTGLDCIPETCTDCKITFSTAINTEKHYEINATVNQQCKISNINLNSYGFYKNVSRAIRLDSATKVSSLVIPPETASADFTAQGNMTIEVIVQDPYNIGIDMVIAAITGLGQENYNQCNPSPPLPFIECTYRELEMSPGGGGGGIGSYIVQWNLGIVGTDYIIDIMAIDGLGYCAETSNIIVY